MFPGLVCKRLSLNVANVASDRYVSQWCGSDVCNIVDPRNGNNCPKRIHPTITMSQFIQRLATYLTNEVLIQGLANSKTFQRFAVHTNTSITRLKKTGTQTIQQTIDKYASTSSATASNSASRIPPAPHPPRRGFAGFVSAFVKEVQSDLGIKTR
jgi:hypothetical protein